MDDMQDFKSAHAFAKCAKYIGPDGRRQDAAHRYIHPRIADGKHPNLHLLCETKVNRVIFEGNRAVGVEYEPEPAFVQPGLGAPHTVSRTIRAKKLVVVSAGALGTPPILERSGIGKKELLQELDIPVISDLPGVGENYQDHHFLLIPYETNLKENETLDRIMGSRFDVGAAMLSQDPYLGWNGVDVAGKLRMSDSDAAALGPEFKEAWDRDFAGQPEKPLMLFVATNFLAGGDRTLLTPEDLAKQYVTVASYTAYPYSRGSVHIVSRDCTVAPKFITGFLADKNEIDLKKAVWAYKKGRDIFRRTKAFVGEPAIGHPKFREGSKAALADKPVLQGDDRTQVKPIEYDEEDNRAIEDHVRSHVETTWHSLGTCKLAPREEGGVIDKNLNVYGTEGLKCVGK